ncbi:hypothetical protein [Solidesulfovibrio sp.]
MSRKLILGSSTAFYSYNPARHTIDARVMHQGQLIKISGRSLGEVKNTLLVLAQAARTDVWTLVPARSA